MRFGKIKRFLALGGGRILPFVAELVRAKGYEIIAFSGRRQLEEKCESGKSLEKVLRQNKIPYYASEDIRRESRLGPLLCPGTMALSFDAPWIFTQEFIDLFKGRFLNSHGTRLPRYRGGGGFSWQILRNNRLGASCLHLMEPGIDQGDIVFLKEFIYPEACVVPQDYFNFAFERDRAMLTEFLDLLEKDHDFPRIAQEEAKSLYFPRLSTKEQGYVNWSWKTEAIYRFICAFDDPYPGASSFVHDSRVFIKKADRDLSEGPFHPFQSGLIYRKNEKGIFVASSDGGIILGELQNEAGENMQDQLKLGDRFYTPQRNLDSARAYRALYTALGLKENATNQGFEIPSRKGEGIYLKQLQPENVTVEYCQWLNDPEVNRFLELRFKRHTLESVREYVRQKLSGEEMLFGIFLSEPANRHIGNIKLGPIHPVHLYADIGIMIGDKNSWGKGLASKAIRLLVDYAFHQKGLRKLTAGVYSGHEASLKAFQKNGFEIEAIQKDHCYFEGRYIDRLALRLLNLNFKPKPVLEESLHEIP